MPKSVRLPAQGSTDVSFRIQPWVGVAIRLGLVIAWPALGTALGGRVEISTPVTSYKRLRECVYLYTHGISLYDGSVCHEAPLLVALFEYIPVWASPFVFIAVDYVTAILLVRIAEYKRGLQMAEIWPDPVSVDDDQAETDVVPDDQIGVGNVPKSANTPGNADASLQDRSADDEHKKPKNPSDLHAPWSDDPTRPVDALIVPEDVGALHLLNPLGILACAAQTTQTLSALGIIAALYFATRGRGMPAALALATASYLSLYPVILISPCLILLSRASGIPIAHAAMQILGGFVLFVGAFIYVSHLMVGNWSFLNATYGTILFVTDLTPNVGLYWYFFIEMFDQFRTFFLAVFHITACIFSIPVTLCFHHSPLSATFLLASFTAIFKAYPSIADTWLYMSLAALFPEAFKYARHTFFASTALIYAAFLGPLFYNLWVYSGAGNANFFYAITLVYALAQIIFVVDLGFGMLRREWERVHPGWRQMRLEIVHM